VQQHQQQQQQQQLMQLSGEITQLLDIQEPPDTPERGGDSQHAGGGAGGDGGGRLSPRGTSPAWEPIVPHRTASLEEQAQATAQAAQALTEAQASPVQEDQAAADISPLDESESGGVTAAAVDEAEAEEAVAPRTSRARRRLRDRAGELAEQAMDDLQQPEPEPEREPEPEPEPERETPLGGKSPGTAEARAVAGAKGDRQAAAAAASKRRREERQDGGTAAAGIAPGKGNGLVPAAKGGGGPQPPVVAARGRWRRGLRLFGGAFAVLAGLLLAFARRRRPRLLSR
jgi:hypothetical protein